MNHYRIEQYKNKLSNSNEQKSYLILEKDIAFSFYLSSITISWIIAAILGSLPLAQIGSYIYDTTCTTCELDWKMEHSSQLGFNVTILILGGLIPIIMM